MGSEGDGIAGAAVDFDEVPLVANPDHSVIGVFDEIGDDDVLSFASEFFDDVLEQIMRERSRRQVPLHAAVDAGGFEDTDQNWKAAIPVDFAKKDHLLIIDLADNDPGKFHLYKHVLTPVIANC